MLYIQYMHAVPDPWVPWKSERKRNSQTPYFSFFQTVLICLHFSDLLKRSRLLQTPFNASNKEAEERNVNYGFLALRVEITKNYSHIREAQWISQKRMHLDIRDVFFLYRYFTALKSMIYFVYPFCFSKDWCSTKYDTLAGS